MFGAMPSDFLVFEVSEEQTEERSVSQETQPSEADVKWDLNTSIFAPRRKEAESRSFWDTERLIKKALDVDYGRMLKEERVLRLISKSDAAVVRGDKTAKESLEEVKKAIAPSYRAFLSVFNFYCITPSSSTRGAFSIQPNQFTKMMQDADLAGNYISAEEVGKIFVLVNFESDKVDESRSSSDPSGISESFPSPSAYLRSELLLSGTAKRDSFIGDLKECAP